MRLAWAVDLLWWKIFHNEELHSTERHSVLISVLTHTPDKIFLHWYKQEPTYHQISRQRGMFS